MAFTEARMIRRKVILLVVRQSSFPLNPHALLFIFVAILRATEPCIPYYPHRRASFLALTTDVSWKIEIVNEILSSHLLSRHSIFKGLEIFVEVILFFFF